MSERQFNKLVKVFWILIIIGLTVDFILYIYAFGWVSPWKLFDLLK